MNAIYAKIENMEGVINSFKNSCDPEVLKKLEKSVEELSVKFSAVSAASTTSSESIPSNSSVDNSLLTDKLSALEKVVAELSTATKSDDSATDSATDAASALAASNDAVSSVAAFSGVITDLTEKLNVVFQHVGELSMRVSALNEKLNIVDQNVSELSLLATRMDKLEILSSLFDKLNSKVDTLETNLSSLQVQSE